MKRQATGRWEWEAMGKEKKRCRRVVTRREYMAYQAKKWMYVSRALLQVLLCITGVVGAFYFLTHITTDGSDVLHFALLLVYYLILGCSCLLFDKGVQNIQKARTIEPVTPLTRHNTGNLPEPETLVRASEEPPARQSNVLLRAAQGSQVTAEEQLLRPVEK